MKKRLLTMLLCVVLAANMFTAATMAADLTVVSASKTNSIVGTLVEDEENRISIPGSYAFTPKTSGIYVIDYYYDYDLDGESCYAEHLAPMKAKAGQNYEIVIPGDTYAKGQVVIYSVNSLTFGTQNLFLAEEYELITYGFEVTEKDTYHFTTRFGQEVLLKLRGTKDGVISMDDIKSDSFEDDEEGNIDCTYTLDPGIYYLILENDTWCENNSGTFTVSHTNHNLKKSINADGTYQMKCTVCGYVDEATSHASHSFGAWSADTATALKTGCMKRVCKVCQYTATKKTAKLKATVKLSAAQKKIQKGKTYTLVVSKLAKGDKVASVKSSNTKVASVKKLKTNRYKITAQKKGTAAITVKLASGKTAKCKITVR